MLDSSHWLAFGVVLAYAALCWHCLAPGVARQPSAHHVLPSPSAEAQTPPLPLVAFASQSGQAADLAERLNPPGARPAQALNKVTVEQLQGTRKALFVVSTYGDGEPPDNALVFVRRVSALASDARALASLQFSVLALGDRQYPKFCAFGHRLHAQLIQAGAQALTPVLCVDGQDQPTLHSHQQRLQRQGLLPDRAIASSEITASDFTDWQLIAREQVNTGSPGLPLWRIQLQAPSPLSWQAGDLLSVEAEEAPGNARDYSIASLPDSGFLELLVREHRRDDGQPGLVSSLLCHRHPPGKALRCRLRPNPAFHPPEQAQPLVLIGNGSGMGALRALLCAREQQGAHDNLLFFGERDPRFDLPYRADLERWFQSAHLKGLHSAFSRAQPSLYVQDAIAAAGDELQGWIDKGAVLMVCGSLAMGNAVTAELARLLGEAGFDALCEDGRYRREVY